MIRSYKIIAVDFDGTLCEDIHPDIGEPNHELIEYIKERQKNGDKIILWTCRVGKTLEEAMYWCADRGLIFDSINANYYEMITEFRGDTRKIFADEYIDDRMCTQFKLPYKRKEK